MVFEPYSEVVLPPDKGTGITRKKGKPAQNNRCRHPRNTNDLPTL